MKGHIKRQKKNSICGEASLQLHEYCGENGIDIEWITERQCRLSDGKIRVDVFPLGKRYHNITIDERGGYADLIGFMQITFI